MSDITANGLDDIKVSIMRDGTETRALYVKNWSLGDWEIVEQIKAQNGMKSYADVIRWAIRRAAGRI
jgi:hypothetical protein